MTVLPFKTRRDAHMDELTMKVAQVCDGESGFDVACVTSFVAVWTIGEGYNTKAAKMKALKRVIAMMNQVAHQMYGD